MTNAQRLAVKLSEIRSRLNELSGLDTLTDEHRSELDAKQSEFKDAESQYRAALLSETEDEKRAALEEPDSEMRERVELRGRSSVANYLTSAMSGRLPGGAEAELNAAAGIAAGQIPMELWEVRNGVEKRVVTNPPGVVGLNLDVIRPAVFANAVMPMLGVEMPQVGSGTYATATISTSLTAAAYGQGDGRGGDCCGIHDRDINGQADFRTDSRSKLRTFQPQVGTGNFESSLRENMSLVLSAELDRQSLEW